MGASESRAKRPRTAAVASSADHSKRPSRVWSQADELVILRGLITYRAKRGVLPGSTQDIDKLHSYIRSQLSVKVSITQLSDKVRRLKQKYQLLATRAKTGREDFPTPHDQSIYEVAKKVWGTMSIAGDGGGSGYDNVDAGESEDERYGEESDDDMECGRDNRQRKNQRLMPVTMANGNGTGMGAVNANVRGRSDFEKGKDVYPYLWETVEELSSQHPSGAVFKKAFELLEGSKAQVMEEKLRKFRLTEMRQQLRRMDLMKDTLSMVLDALEMAD
uniref:Glabrous enhancer-binding protein-like DBD domain-containing protein n=2 Tax=Oryza brachyantha TaxID=4533 RepID=J3MY05_ORYBR